VAKQQHEFGFESSLVSVQ